MNAKFFIEAFGYLGSALVVVSMLMTSVVKLRVINMIGSIIFAIYALIIKSYPTALMNFFLVGINIYHLLRLRDSKNHFNLVQLEDLKGYTAFFLEHYGEDIRKFFPGFGKSEEMADTAFLVCCDSIPAGLLVGKSGSGNAEGGKNLHVELDYSTPVYRDCSVGTFLYGKLPSYGFNKLICRSETAEHTAYLEKMGFTKNGAMYEKKL